VYSEKGVISKKTLKDIANKIRKYTNDTSLLEPDSMPLNISRVYDAGHNEGYEKGYSAGDQVGFYNGYSIGFDEGKVEGSAEGQERFFDIYQQYGQRENYSYAFAFGWNSETFKPTHDINAVSASGMFRSTGITDLKSALEEHGLKLNITHATPEYLAQGSALTNCPELGVAFTNLTNAFNGCTGLARIDKLNMSAEKNCTCTSAFRNCESLEYIRFNQGIRPTNLNLESSKNLEKDSFSSENLDEAGYGLIPALSDAVTGSVTVSDEAVKKSFTEEEWAALTDKKPTWTIVRS
jgi:hypothetical protein